MGSAAVALPCHHDFDLPPLLPAAERRLAGLARACWRRHGGRAVPGFKSHSVVIADPTGRAVIESIGAPVAGAFALAVGMTLDGRDGLAAEIRAACDFIAVDPRPLPFEASLASPGIAAVLVRGIALPIGEAHVHIVVSWRELLDRTATRRLREEIGLALALARPPVAARDPFLRQGPG